MWRTCGIVINWLLGMDLDPFTSKVFTSLLLGKSESPIHNQLTDVRIF